MESALGRTLPEVRVHTDTTAVEVASGMHARAFSVGPHIGFAPGEYRPGTLVGDAIIAHELAHRLQQDDSRAVSQGRGPLESDADHFAARMLGRMFSPDAASPTMPSMRTGLKLQGCTKENIAENRKLPGMGLDEGLAPGQQSKKYTLDEYRDLWSRKMRFRIVCT